MNRKTNSAKDSEQTLAEAFCLNAFQMLGSMYMARIISIPNNIPVTEDINSSETKHAFQSRVVDLKLRRLNDKANVPQDEFNYNFLEFNENYAEYLNTKEENAANSANPKKLEVSESETNKPIKHDDLMEAFSEMPAKRPTNYKYILNQEKDNEKVQKQNVKGMNLRKIEKEYQARLNMAKEKGINRAKRRAERMQRGNSPYYGAPNNINEKYYQRSEDSRANT